MRLFVLSAANAYPFGYRDRLVASPGAVIVDRLRPSARALFGVPGGGGNLGLIDAARARDLPFV
jgi:hypothetical protein